MKNNNNLLLYYKAEAQKQKLKNKEYYVMNQEIQFSNYDQVPYRKRWWFSWVVLFSVPLAPFAILFFPLVLGFGVAIFVCWWAIGDYSFGEVYYKKKDGLECRKNLPAIGMKMLLIAGILFSSLIAFDIHHRMVQKELEELRELWYPKNMETKGAQQFGDDLEFSNKGFQNETEENLQLGRQTSALYGAVKYGNVEMGRELLEKGADVNEKAVAPLPPNWENMINHPEIRKRLARSGANLDAKVIENMTPLHVAAERSVYSMVQLLLDHGADVNMKNQPSRQTPLFGAVIMGQKKNVKLLLDYDADVNTQDIFEAPPFIMPVITIDWKLQRF